MQDVPLTSPTSSIAPSSTSATRGSSPRRRRAERPTYADWAERTRRLGGVLDALGISSDGRVATFAWNTARHLELYFAAPCTGRVLHTLNIRLFPEQLTYIVNHADDEVIFVDRSLLGLLAPLLPTFERLRASRRDGRRQRATSRADLARSRAARLRGAARRRRPGRVPRRRRAPGREHVLHERHDRQPERRRLQPPQHVPAHDGGDDGRLRSAPESPTASCPVVPMFHANAWGSPTPAWPPAPTS